MEMLKQIAGMDSAERFVFFCELYDTGHGDDFVTYIASLPRESLAGLLENFPRYERDRIEEALDRMGSVDEKTGQSAATYLRDVLNRMGELMDRQKKLKAKNRKQTAINRDFMKEWLTREKGISDQMKGMPCPPLQKAPGKDAVIVTLPEPSASTLARNDLFAAIRDRQSRRRFSNQPLTLDELSFLLWSTQGIKKCVADGRISIRTVPSAGARHPFETYIGINHVEGLEPGMYHYLPVDHSLELCFRDESLVDRLIEVGVGQRFVGECAACFIWSCIPYRGEWRYNVASHKNMLLDAGHVCQNLYLACETIGCGTCAIGAYNQEIADSYLGLDGKDEFVVYLSPVGKLPVK
ncbi:MAG TPA: SagB/ThcOx family dehydrogenase [bacterium]|nr:SagB/ThcOx family dehydrogenase [bacterium]